MVVLQNGVVYSKAPGEPVNTVYAQNGTGAQLQKYSEWKAKAGSTSLYVKNPSTLNRSQVVDMRPRTRSISPTRYQQRSMERGRASKRMIMTPQPVVVTSNANSSLRMNTINAARIRSRSAPPLRQPTIVSRVPQSTGYTQSHFLAIKQPFSKRFLLPPVKVSERYVPVGSQRVIVAQRPTVINRPQPQQNVIKGKVYHVQYNPNRNTTITEGRSTVNVERTVVPATQHVTRQYYQGNNTQLTQSRSMYATQLSYNSDVFENNGMYERQNSSNGGIFITDQNGYSPYVYKSQPAYYTQQNLVPLSEYTPKIMKTSFYQKRAQGWTFAENGGNSRPTSRSFEQTTTTVTKPAQQEAIYSQVIKTREVDVSKTDNADEYTIIDYVENGPTTEKNVSPLSTSTPRFPDRDTSALDDLDDVLRKSESLSATSSDEN